jgi:hypothetical protein
LVQILWSSLRLLLALLTNNSKMADGIYQQKRAKKGG